MSRFDLLWRALERAGEMPPADQAVALAALPPVGQLPSPWETWLLIALVRHSRRQLWVGDLVTSRLHGDLGLIGRCGYGGHPRDFPPRGLVPGLTEWEYDYHGIGCCLSNRITGELIDVDFYDASAEYFDPWFYLLYLKQLKTPEPPEARLLELHPSHDSLRLGFDALRRAGVLVPFAQSHVCRLSDEVLAHEGLVDQFCAAWADATRRPWLAALIGDWLVVSGAPERSTQIRQQRGRELRSVYEEAGPDQHLALLALADLDADDLDEYLQRALKSAPDGTIWAALEIIRKRRREKWYPHLYRLLRRLDPGECPHIWKVCLEMLLEGGYRPAEVRVHLPQAAGIAVAEAALLALEHASEHALALFRRALRSHIPFNRCTAASILALLDRAWSRRELLAVLVESDEQEPTAECRAALLETHDKEAHQAVYRWEQDNPHEPSLDRHITIGDAMLQGRASWARHEMTQWHDRVMPLRDRSPPLPPAS